MSRDSWAGLYQVWEASVQEWGTRPALVGQGDTLTFLDVDTLARGVAAQVQEFLDPGVPVLVDLPRGSLWLPAMLGLWRAGCVAVPLPPSPSPLRKVLASDTGAAAVLSYSVALDRIELRPLHADVQSGQPSSALGSHHAYVMATSGSTGDPKLVAVTHRTSTAVMQNLASSIPALSPGVSMHTAAFTFSSSIRQLLLPLIQGHAVLVTDAKQRFDPEYLFGLLKKHNISFLDLTPSQVSMMATYASGRENMVRLRLQRLLVASEVFTPGVLKKWLAVASEEPQHVYHLYGQTELGGAISAIRVDHLVTLNERESVLGGDSLPVGVPSGAFHAVLDEVSEDGQSELLIGGLDSEDGYLTGEGLDRSRYEVKRDGHSPLYRTGDNFSFEPSGSLRFLGRSDSTLKIGAVRVDVWQLEQEALKIPEVLSVAVSAAITPLGTQFVRVAYTGATEQSHMNVESQLRDLADSYMHGVCSTQVVRLDEFPLTISGKLDRPALTRQLAQLATTGDAGSTDGYLEAIWRAATVHEGSDPGANFFGLGGNSLSMLQLLAAVQNRFHVRIRPAEFFREPTLHGLIKLVARESNLVEDPSPLRAPWTKEQLNSPILATHVQNQFLVVEKIYGTEFSRSLWLRLKLRLVGDINLARLRRALELVMDRHDALQAEFQWQGSELFFVPNREGAPMIASSPSEENLAEPIDSMVGGP